MKTLLEGYLVLARVFVGVVLVFGMVWLVVQCVG